jgi:acyl-CoA synthetase (AMP-forming)/AMP-acid ligase II
MTHVHDVIYVPGADISWSVFLVPFGPKSPCLAIMMHGLMQSHHLSIASLIEHAEVNHGGVEIVSRTVEDPSKLHRTTWRGIAMRAKQVAHALDSLRIPFSGRVATLAWNGCVHSPLCPCVCVFMYVCIYMCVHASLSVWIIVSTVSLCHCFTVCVSSHMIGSLWLS